MAAQDFGIIISQPGTAVSGAATNQIIMNTSNPFIKLDTQNPKAFQSIFLLITTDPPEPVGPATNTYTTVCSFAHGYKYIPSIETLFNVTVSPPGTTFLQTYFLDNGQIGGMTINDGAFLYAIADSTKVYFIVNKFKGAGGSSNLLTGTTIAITPHVFVDGVLD
jgi:hypothetical protein